MDMNRPEGNKPHLIVVAASMNPHMGSEPGKGWWWAKALSPFFHLHIITQQHHEAECRPVLDQTGEPWEFHLTQTFITTWKFQIGYLQYKRFLDKALELSREIMEQHPIVGLCHVVIGSFRVLPRYDLLGIPYTLGPFGGGEKCPASYLWDRPVPWTHKAMEAFRPLFNDLFARIPALCSCMRAAQLVLTTSEETESVVKRMGASKTAVVFPDSYDNPIDVAAVIANSTSKKSAIRTKIRLLWQGRPLWWKGPDLALLALRKALDQGICAELTMVGYWDNPFGQNVKKLTERLGLTSHVAFVGGMPRDAFLQMMDEQHAFITPSLHDSGGIPLIEAQAKGLPCLTPGLGGHKESACPEAGVSHCPQGTHDYIDQVVRCLAEWQKEPDLWLEQSKKAVAFSREFTNQRLQGYVRDWIVPAFQSAN